MIRRFSSFVPLAFFARLACESDPSADDLFDPVAPPHQCEATTAGDESVWLPSNEDIIAVMVDLDFHIPGLPSDAG
jgi:hypothetical protein